MHAYKKTAAIVIPREKVPRQKMIGCAIEAERTITMSCDPVETRTISESREEEALDKNELSNGDMTN